MSVQEVADKWFLETPLKRFSLDPLEPENGASLRRRILCLPEEEPELLW
jgi:hypothetical protein